MSADPINLEERDQRWLRIRCALEENGLDGLLVVIDGHIERRGSIHYVSNWAGGASATLMWHYIIFPLKGNPVAVNIKSGWIDDRRMLSFRGAWVPESEPYAEVIAGIIRDLNIGSGNIGIEGDFMPVPVFQRLGKALPQARFAQVNIIHELKRVKSPVEIQAVEQDVEAVDSVFEACLQFAKPGMTWNDITSEICRNLYRMGAEDIGGYPMSRSTGIIQTGDSYNCYPEPQMRWGYWMQFGRVISFGEPSKELRDAWELNIRAQESGAEKLRPGKTGADVMKAINDSLKGSRYTGAPRSSGHGIGLDILEKPYISLDEETEFVPGMLVGIHPVFTPPNPAFEANADLFVVTKDKPCKLSRITPEIKVIR
jgi:Xaa-Pro aminopeptidase